MKKIALIENDVSTVINIQTQLIHHGYTVVGWAGNASKGIELIKSTQPDLIILDYELDDNTKGSAVARFVKNCMPIPIIYLTEHEDSETINDIGNTAYDVYLPKPFPTNSLIFNIENVLRRWAEKPVSPLIQFLSNSQTVYLPVEQVLWVERVSNENGIYVTTMQQQKHYRIYQSLDEFLQQNPLPHLQRISRYAILNMAHVVDILRGQVFKIPHLFDSLVGGNGHQFTEFELGKTYRKDASVLIAHWQEHRYGR
jgi:DNA-binding response OmpR family regulator